MTSEAASSVNEGSDPLGPELDAFLDAHLEELIAFRRRLHAHPERSRKEFETTSSVVQRLEVAGLDARVLASGTGALCDVDGGLAGPTVALRADLDALGMADNKDVPYRSQFPGVAHACGHDVHTPVVLGSGLALAHLFATDPQPGTVRLVFQPAEEAVPGGALDVIADGGLDGVDWIFGLHCDPKLDVGRIGVRAGAITAAADLVTIRLHGPGGHTARPQLTADLVDIAARVVTVLPGALRERAAPLGALNLVFGAIHAGDAANVIPALAELRGTVRSPDRAAWDQAPDFLEEIIESIATPRGATFEIDYSRGAPPVDNDADATAIFAAAATEVLGAGKVTETPQSQGGDDFSWYLEHVRGTYARLGVHDPDSGRGRLDLHSSDFDVDERAIAIGIRVMVTAAIRALRSPAPG